MLKYQVRSTSSLNRASTSTPVSSRRSPFSDMDRSTSMSSLSSVDSGENSDWGTLKVYTGQIKADTDYKTIRISTGTSTRTAVSVMLNKFRLSCRDPNLFELCMELRTKRHCSEISSVLVLPDDARPLELQRCHPLDMSRFFLHVAEGILIRIHDYLIIPQSNYKSLLVARRTTCRDAISLVLMMNRIETIPDDFRLVRYGGSRGESTLHPDDLVAEMYLQLKPAEQIRVELCCRR